jgi:FKBP-type peptidyl-prolyl cis-trans isomerase
MKRLFLLLGALSLSACLGDATGPTPSNPATETFASSLGVNLTDGSFKKTASGTYYKDLTVGTGTALNAPTATTEVDVTYTGWLKSGSQFDTGTNLKFALGGVIFGFVDGMLGMNVGGERLVVIPSELAYGNTTQNGPTATIPPNSTLIFRIKLNSFK